MNVVVNEKTGKITGVALGPGDPELITIKALKALEAADAIFYPVTINGRGEQNSMAFRVLNGLNISEDKFKPVAIAMKYDRGEVTQTYQNLASDCMALCNCGKKVVIASEGDISFYSTFAYLIDEFKKAGQEYDMIPGVPAFILGGALSKAPICTQSDKVIVVPDIANEKDLNALVKANQTVVMMKVSKVKGWIVPFLNKTCCQFFYGEYLGTDKAFFTTDIKELEGHQIPYFSIIIIKHNSISSNLSSLQKELV